MAAVGCRLVKLGRRRQILGQALGALAHQPGQAEFRLDIALEGGLPVPFGGLGNVLFRRLQALFIGAGHRHLGFFVAHFGELQLFVEGNLTQRLGHRN